MGSYLGSGNGPDLVVVRAHEHISNTFALHSQNPLVKVLGLGVGDAALHGSVNKAIDSLDLILLGENRDVVLEGVWHPEALVANIGDSLVGVPVIVLGQSLVEAVIKVLVVGEDDVTAHIVQLFQIFCQFG